MRPVLWLVFLLAAAVRPGVDRFDRWLAGVCWNIPSAWNAVADVAIRTGAVDGTVAGTLAPWRQASVLPVDGRRIAIVTVSDMTTARVTFLTDRYEPLGALTRVVRDPALITDEARGYKPLSHAWPLVVRDGRIATLVAFAPMRSDPPNLGLYAYLGIGPADNEVLFICRLGAAPGPLWGVLTRSVRNGRDVLAVFPRGRQDEPALASFSWNDSAHRFDAVVSGTGRPIVSWWSTSAGGRVLVPSGDAIDPVVERLAASLPPVSSAR